MSTQTGLRGERRVPLRPYQEEAVQAVLRRYAEGVHRPLVALPTGSGKTIVFGDLIHRRGGRALVLAHRDELIQQAVDKFTMIDPLLDVGVVKAERNEADREVVVASVQSLHPRRLAQLERDAFDTIVVDEAHHAAAESYQRILGYLGAFDLDGPLVLGVTATPERGDGKALGNTWDEIVYQRSILDMIEQGYLCDLRGLRVQLALDLDAVKTSRGDYQADDLDRAMADADAPEHAVRAFTEHAADRRALVFTPTVLAAQRMAEAFGAAGISAEWVSGDTQRDERRAILRRLRSGETQVLANCAVLTEGFDEPAVDCVIVARPTRSRLLYVQMVGRGTRIHPGKADCLVIDLVGATARHQLITLGRLFKLREGEVEDAEQTVTQAVAAQQARPMIERPQRQGKVVAVPVSLLRRTFAWTDAGGGAFSLDIGDRGRLFVQPVDDGSYQVLQLPAWNPDAVVRTPTVLASGLDLGYAQGFAEDRARERAQLTSLTAGWRTQPASEKQLSLLERWGIRAPEGMTKGEASDLIDQRTAQRDMRRIRRGL